MKINFNDNVPDVKMRVCSRGNRSTEEELIVHPECLWQIPSISRVYLSKLPIVNMPVITSLSTPTHTSKE